MNETHSGSIEALIRNRGLMTEAVCRAAREAVLKHAREGNPVATWRDGRVVWITPEEIFARFGNKSGESSTSP
jgi:hypothetical protein